MIVSSFFEDCTPAWSTSGLSPFLQFILNVDCEGSEQAQRMVADFDCLDIVIASAGLAEATAANSYCMLAIVEEEIAGQQVSGALQIVHLSYYFELI